jgi:hypothetical protein
LESDNEYIPTDTSDSNEEPECDVNPLDRELDTTITESQPEITELNCTPTKRHKRRTPEKWKRQIIKTKRLNGENYRNEKGKERQARVMGAPCTSTHCIKSSLRSCQSLTEEERKEIFNKFWSINSWEERRSTVRALVDKVCIFKGIKIKDFLNK